MILTIQGPCLPRGRISNTYDIPVLINDRLYKYVSYHKFSTKMVKIPIAYLSRLPWIFPGFPLKINGAPGNIQSNLDMHSIEACITWELFAMYLKVHKRSVCACTQTTWSLDDKFMEEIDEPSWLNFHLAISVSVFESCIMTSPITVPRKTL